MARTGEAINLRNQGAHVALSYVIAAERIVHAEGLLEKIESGQASEKGQAVQLLKLARETFDQGSKDMELYRNEVTINPVPVVVFNARVAKEQFVGKYNPLAKIYGAEEFSAEQGGSL